MKMRRRWAIMEHSTRSTSRGEFASVNFRTHMKSRSHHTDSRLGNHLGNSYSMRVRKSISTCYGYIRPWDGARNRVGFEVTERVGIGVYNTVALRR